MSIVASANAETWDWQGRLLAGAILPTSASGQWIQKNLWAANELNTTLGSDYHFHSKIFYTYSDSPYHILPKDQEGEFSRMELSEIEINRYFFDESIKIGLGKSIIKWGKMDATSALDVYKSKRNFLQTPDSYWQDRGQWQTQLKFLKFGNSPWALDLNYSWRGESSDITLPKNKVPFQLALEREKNDASFFSSNDREEIGAKVTYTGELQDFEFIGFHGYEHLSLLEQRALLISGGNATIVLAPLHLKKDVLAVAWSKALETWLLRAEIAQVEYSNHAALLHENMDQQHAAMGVEKNVGDDLRIIIETNYTRRVEKAEKTSSSSSIVNALRQSNRNILGPLQRDRFGLFLHAFYQLENVPEWKYELSSMNYSGDQAGLLLPKISYEWFSGLRSQLFAQVYWGKNDSPLGQLKDFNSLGVAIEYFY